MHRNHASSSSKESIHSNKKDKHTESETFEQDQIEAVRDLYSTYIHPVKCSYQTNSKNLIQKKNLISVLKQREFGLINFHRYPDARHQTMDRYFYYEFSLSLYVYLFLSFCGLLPNKCEVIASMANATFCGQFSEDGQRFISACQDQCIRFYDTSSSRTFQNLDEIAVDNVGWAILDTALSPDRNSIAYSTWSDCIYLVKLNENRDRSIIVPLYLRPNSHNFSIFSLQYSVDGSEIIGGSNDTHVYIYDLQKQKRILRVQAHEDDVNAVRFIDNSNSLIVSGSDDNLISVWDRRALNESQPKPVGIFAGHTNGITFVHSRMDTRYLISNSKDQSIKLWDMRRFANESMIEKSRAILNSMNNGWDYRYEAFGRRPKKYDISGDPSVRTYHGHSVAYTLIRCYFSPSFTTGQKYIITGSADGCIRIYDVLSGDVKLCLRVSNNSNETREKCVRDVSWHPYENYIISTSWDHRRSHVRWIHSFNESSSLNESNVISFQTPDSPPRNRPTTLRRLLLRQFLGDESNSNSDEDSSIFE